MLKVNIIVPCYNYGHFISETLDCLLQQTYNNWECSIVDDGSTDNSKDIISAYINRDKRFVYIYQENKGLSAARNTGIKAANGDFIQFLDADDLIEKRKLELQIQYFKEHPEVDIVYGDVRYFSTEQPDERLFSMDGINQPWMPKVSGKGREILKHLVTDNIMAVSSPLIRKKVFDICGLFNESLVAYEDWDYWLRCTLNNVVFGYYDPSESMTLIRYHRQSMSKNTETMMKMALTIRKRLSDLLKRDDIYLSNKKHYANTGITLAIDCLLKNKQPYGVWLLGKYLFIYFTYVMQKPFYK